jgi:prepilin-type N-terminal cleavage/methylation domain-containing protein
MKSYRCQVIIDKLPRPEGAVAAHCSSLVTRHSPAFSLIELLVVISILGLLAGLAVPALKDMGKSNVQISATRQLLDDVARARQLAMSQRITVYMVFVPTNFWVPTWMDTSGMVTPAFTSLTPVQQQAVTNLMDKQLSGYRFMAYGRLGDQPGQHAWHYLDDKWQSLPEGSFISPYKFYISRTAPAALTIPEWKNQHLNSDGNIIYPFQTNAFPFPTEDSPRRVLPCIAFNYQGRLVKAIETDGVDPSHYSYLFTDDAYLPLEQGIVGYGVNPSTKAPVPTFLRTNDILERPPGNATGIGYNIIHIDALTGRATLETFKLK